jgi:hypothetical protein
LTVPFQNGDQLQYKTDLKKYHERITIYATKPKKSKDILHITLNRALLSRKGILDI